MRRIPVPLFGSTPHILAPMIDILPLPETPSRVGMLTGRGIAAFWSTPFLSLVSVISWPTRVGHCSFHSHPCSPRSVIYRYRTGAADFVARTSWHQRWDPTGPATNTPY